MSVHIRVAKRADVKIIQQIAKKSWEKAYEKLIPIIVQKKYLNEYYSTEQLYQKLENTHFFVAETGGIIVGFANLFQSETENDLSAIYLSPECQHKGVGNALLETVKKQLQVGDELVVYFEKGNEQAEEFYRKNGFSFLEEFQESLFEHTFHTVKMSLKIESDKRVLL